MTLELAPNKFDNFDCKHLRDFLLLPEVFSFHATNIIASRKKVLQQEVSLHRLYQAGNECVNHFLVVFQTLLYVKR